MAVIGDQLNNPESGWQRYDDTNNMVVYTGTWLTETLAGNYNGSAKYTSTSGSTMSFTFYGTKVRIIGGLYSGRTTTAQVIIDGINVGIINEDSTTSRTKALVFEKIDLSQGKHVVQIKAVDSKTLILDAVDVGEDGYMTRSVGTVLTAPDVDWKRYDDAEPLISYTGFTQRNYVVSGAYEGKSSYNANGSSVGEVVFSFVGTKVRIISSSTNTSRAQSVSVSIDGNVETFTARTATNQAQTLVYEKIGLPYGTHTVKIFNFNGVPDPGGAAFGLDAIDIDSEGRLVRTIGTPLTTPDEGWKRIDDNHPAFKWGGSVTFVSNSTIDYNGTLHYWTDATKAGSSLEFTFIGTKLRIIAGTTPTQAKEIRVFIDGNLETYNPYNTTDIRQILVYEKTGLSNTLHTVKLDSVGAGNWGIDAIDIDSNGQLITTVGSQIPTPDEGWRRYDNLDPQFIINGKWTTFSNASLWKGNSIYFNSTLTDGEIRFRFFGSKLRFIGYGDPNYNMSIRITINGQSETFSSASSANVSQMLCYEKTNLIEGYHDVVIDCNGSSSYWHFDAIDIDSTGRLYHPDEVTSIAELEVGKRIRCNYVALASGAAGEFKNIGKQTSDFISTTSIPSVPNGDFYFIVVDEYNGKKILIADRNIQSTISWDALNSNGLVFGAQKDLGEKNYTFAYRLLTGGINVTDKDNEWDKYIVNSTLNGTIIAGSNGVWNWSGTTRSWTSTTYPSFADRRVQRGGTSADAFIANNNGSIATNTSSTATGYRPLVELETLPMFKSFVKHDGAYKRLDTVTLEWNTISATLPSEDTFINDGMDDLSVLDRKNESFVQTMTANGSLGSGKLFKERIDLKKYFEITSVSVK